MTHKEHSSLLGSWVDVLWQVVLCFQIGRENSKCLLNDLFEPDNDDRYSSNNLDIVSCLYNEDSNWNKINMQISNTTETIDFGTILVLNHCFLICIFLSDTKGKEKTDLRLSNYR